MRLIKMTYLNILIFYFLISSSYINTQPINEIQCKIYIQLLYQQLKTCVSIRKCNELFKSLIDNPYCKGTYYEYKEEVNNDDKKSSPFKWG